MSVLGVSGIGLALLLFVEFVVSILDLLGVGPALRASSQSVSESDSELESDVVASLWWALASGRLKRPVPRNVG